MGDVTHPNFKRKARGGGYETSPRPVILLVTQADFDGLMDIAKTTPGVSVDQHATLGVQAYIKKHRPKPPRPRRIKPKKKPTKPGT